jgi:hypothetical protein
MDLSTIHENHTKYHEAYTVRVCSCEFVDPSVTLTREDISRTEYLQFAIFNF